jgi:hypothetical protein
VASAGPSYAQSYDVIVPLPLAGIALKETVRLPGEHTAEIVTLGLAGPGVGVGLGVGFGVGFGVGVGVGWGVG